ncbi:MAG: transporter permease subunit [Rhizobacter sp.]|nr:transporter permease subunit [Rhizobacter sp.]
MKIREVLRVGWIVPLLMMVALELALRSGRIENPLMLRPAAIAGALRQMLDDGSLTRTTGQTMASACVGWAIGAGVGLLAGLLLGQARALVHSARLWGSFFLAIPSVALVPVVMLVIGFGSRMETTVVAVTCFFAMLLRTTAAFDTVDARLAPLARMLHMGRLQRATALVAPALMPAICRALRLSAVIGFLTAVTIEVAANPQGLGYAVVVAQQTLRPEMMFALLTWTALLAVSIHVGLALLQRYLFSLYKGAQQRTVA